MSDPLNQRELNTYEFEGFTLDAAKRLLFDPEGAPVPLMPKAFDLLFYLASNGQRLIDKDELMTQVWPDTIVEENNLTQNISVLRRALGETRGENRFIATVPGKGYKFVAPVTIKNEILSSLQSDAEKSEPQKPEIKSGTIAKRLGLPLAVVIVLGVIAGLFYYFQSPPAPTQPTLGSIAVLPFKPISTGQRDESLELGMTDTLIRKLNAAQTVVIRPLNAVRRFTALDLDSVEAGRELGVDAVLDGSLQIVGERIRVSAQLLRVSDSRQLWTGQFDEGIRDIFSIQDSIAEKVAGELRVTLGKRGRKSYTESVEAYQLYVRGNLHTRRLVRPEVEKGITYYQQAIDVDPTYALAYVEMANAQRALVLTSDAPPNEMMPKAKAAALKAVELDPELGEAWTALAISEFWYGWDWRQAEKHHKRALELEPNNAAAHFFYAHLLSNIARHGEAVAEIKRAREIEPGNLMINAIEGQILFFAGDVDGSERVLKSTMDLDRNFWLAHLFISRVYLSKNDYDSAINTARKAAELSGGSAEANANVGFALARSGRTDDARKLLANLEERAKSRYVPAYTIASLYAGLGEKEKALDHLEQAFANRDALMVFLLLEPKWDNLRNEPRFAELIEKMNFN